MLQSKEEDTLLNFLSLNILKFVFTAKYKYFFALK